MKRKPYFRLYKDHGGQWRWTCYAANGEQLAVSSEGYKRKRDAARGIVLVQQAKDVRT